MLKAYTVKIDEKMLKILTQISNRTHIPKSALIRKGIEMVITQADQDAVTPELRSEIESMLKEDKGLLDRLAE